MSCVDHGFNVVVVVIVDAVVHTVDVVQDVFST